MRIIDIEAAAAEHISHEIGARVNVHCRSLDEWTIEGEFWPVATAAVYLDSLDFDVMGYATYADSVDCVYCFVKDK